MPPQRKNESHQPTLTLDVEKYQSMLDSDDLSDADRKQVLEALWLLVVSFVDLGFKVEAAYPACGQIQTVHAERPEAPRDVLELSSSLPQKFNKNVPEKSETERGLE